MSVWWSKLHDKRLSLLSLWRLRCELLRAKVLSEDLAETLHHLNQATAHVATLDPQTRKGRNSHSSGVTNWKHDRHGLALKDTNCPTPAETVKVSLRLIAIFEQPRGVSQWPWQDLERCHFRGTNISCTGPRTTLLQPGDVTPYGHGPIAGAGIGCRGSRWCQWIQCLGTWAAVRS